MLIRWLVAGSPWVLPGNIPLSLALELGSLAILVIITPILAWTVYRSEHDWLVGPFEMVVCLNFIIGLVQGPFMTLLVLIELSLAGLGLITLFFSVFCTVRTGWRLIKGFSVVAEAVKYASKQASMEVNNPSTDL